MICDEILIHTESYVMTDVDRKRVWRHQSKYPRNSPNLSAQLLLTQQQMKMSSLGSSYLISFRLSIEEKPERGT